MSKENGFLQLRRGVWEHLRDGRMSHMDALAFIYIVSQADTRTGVWNGSASSLAGEIVISPRNARRLLERLTAARYLKRFPVPGKHVCYPILIHKYPISDGQHKGQHLDAINSKSATGLQYITIKTGEQECEHKGEQKASQKILETGDGKQNTAAKPAPPSVQPADPLEFETKEAAFDVFWEQWPNKQAKSDARRAWLKIPISEYAAIMAGLEKWQKSDQWARKIIPHPATWLNQKRWQDEDVPQKGGMGNGKKLAGSALTDANLKAAGFLQ